MKKEWIAYAYEQKTPGLYECYLFDWRVHIGDLVQDVDGDYYFWPESHDGAWSGWVLELLAKKMEELNKPNRDAENKYFEEHPCTNQS